MILEDLKEHLYKDRYLASDRLPIFESVASSFDGRKQSNFSGDPRNISLQEVIKELLSLDYKAQNPIIELVKDSRQSFSAKVLATNHIFLDYTAAITT